MYIKVTAILSFAKGSVPLSFVCVHEPYNRSKYMNMKESQSKVFRIRTVFFLVFLFQLFFPNPITLREELKMKPKIYLITTIIIVQLNLFFSNIFPKYFAWFEVCVVNFGIKHCYPSKANLRIN